MSKRFRRSPDASRSERRRALSWLGLTLGLGGLAVGAMYFAGEDGFSEQAAQSALDMAQQGITVCGSDFHTSMQVQPKPTKSSDGKYDATSDSSCRHVGLVIGDEGQWQPELVPVSRVSIHSRDGRLVATDDEVTRDGEWFAYIPINGQYAVSVTLKNGYVTEATTDDLLAMPKNTGGVT